jgi:hypothetical protein
MDQRADIEQIRHELEILHARYATYERWGRVLRIFFMIWAPLFAIIVTALLIKLFAFDALMGVFFVGLAIAVAVLLWLIPGSNVSAARARLRWTDLASWPLSGISLESSITDLPLNRRPDAQIIEEQIAERERRLAELGVTS